MAAIPEGEALINSAEARRLAGGVSAMTLWRWEKAGVIPPPLRIRARNYWLRHQFVDALHRAAQQSDAA